MGTFFSGLFRPFRRRQAERTPSKPTPVDVRLEGNYLVIDGEPDADSLEIKHEPGTSDRLVVTWTSSGLRQAKTFPLGGIEFVECSGSRGGRTFYSLTRIAIYLQDAASSPLPVRDADVGTTKAA